MRLVLDSEKGSEIGIEFIYRMAADKSGVKVGKENSVKAENHATTVLSEATDSKNSEDLALYVQDLLRQMQDKFQNMSNNIISKIDDMENKIDELENSIGELMTQAGVDDSSSKPSSKIKA
eukprot:Sdes_comp23098_c0_seq1m21418